MVKSGGTSSGYAYHKVAAIPIYLVLVTPKTFTVMKPNNDDDDFYDV